MGIKTDEWHWWNIPEVFALVLMVQQNLLGQSFSCSVQVIVVKINQTALLD